MPETLPPITLSSIDKFTNSYIECALWSSTDNATESGGEPLDDNFGPEDLAPAALAQMAGDCRDFQDSNREDLDACGLSLERQGHNFWLNRNGHGSGFWDEYFNDSPEAAACSRLSDASHIYGTCDIYVGDDGMLYV